MKRNSNPFIYISGIFASAWVVMSWMRPDTDFYLFPVLIAASVPIAYRLAVGRLSIPIAMTAGAAGAVNTAVVALILNVTGVLAQGRLIAGVGPVGQAIALGIGGATVGVLIASGPVSSS